GRQTPVDERVVPRLPRRPHRPLFRVRVDRLPRHLVQPGALVAWALLILGVLAAVAHSLRRAGRWLAAGIFAFATVAAFGLLVAALWSWFGWLKNVSGGPFSAFHADRFSLELLILVFGGATRRRFRFPFIALITLTARWLFLTDVVSGGGSWSAVVTLLI